MTNISNIQVLAWDGTQENYIVIDRGNGEFTSMLKSTYDEMIAAQENQPTL
jgi:hypothetical protein